MKQMLVLSLLAFLFITYQFIKVLKIKDAPKSNKLVAWVLYGICMIGLIFVANMF